MQLNRDLFSLKVMYNLVSTYKGTYVDDSILKIVYEYNVFAGPWRQHYKEKMHAYIEKVSELEKSFVSPKDFLTRDDVQHLVGMIYDHNPELSEAWPLQQNTILLADLLDLNDIEKLILDLTIRLYDSNDYEYRTILGRLDLSEESKKLDKLYGRIFGISHYEVEKSLKGFLLSSGILEENSEFKCLHSLDEEMAPILTGGNLTLETLESKLFPSAISTQLTVDNYPHLDKEISRCEIIINKSLANEKNKANLMFWGLPGTGKTELVFALAKKNNWNLKVIGDISPEDMNEKSRAQRLTSLKIAMKLFSKDNNTVLLFDEMEDLFKEVDTNASFSKAFVNRIIETTPRPIIWTTNDLYCVGSAVLRRMVYNISFKIPPAKARKNIWETYTSKYGVELSDDAITDFAENFPIVPALIGNAIKISQMAGLEQEDLPEILSSLDTLMNYGEERHFNKILMKDTPYRTEFANTSINLNILTERLLKAKPNFKLCLYGAPGTGKSEYGRYLAKLLKKRVLFKRASDLQSPFVGMTEKNIARMFKQAKEEENLIIIDEGDSFLRSRENARSSYEISQVNEMLSQLEVHTQPFIITTNMMDNLDAAALRRFTFKVKFDFATIEQAKGMFVEYFNNEPPQDIEKNDILAPGDFAVVKQKADILNIDDPIEIYNMLVEECDLKPQKVKKIGF